MNVTPDTPVIHTVLESRGTALCWSRRGEVACAAHAPERASVRWVNEHWADMPIEVQQRPSGVHFQCQHCSTSGSPLVHRPRYEDA